MTGRYGQYNHIPHRESNEATPTLVAGRGRVLSGREADLVLRDVVGGVEPLEPRVAVDEVEALAAVRAEVSDNEVDAVRVAAERAVELRRDGSGGSAPRTQISAESNGGTYRAGPDLSIGGELIGLLSIAGEQKVGLRMAM